MKPNLQIQFLEVLKLAHELPEGLRSPAAEIKGCGESCFDETYIAFLDEQIALSPRGPAWTERLKVRRAGLAPFCNVRLISGHVRVGTSGFTIYVDPQAKRVAYCEEYEDEFPVRRAGNSRSSDP